MTEHLIAILEILKNAILITGLVMIMMLMIEYINVATKGHEFQSLQKSPFLQIIIAALLGIIPGCIGGFAAVSLFTHSIINYGALLAAMIASAGDDAFVMFAMVPKIAMLVTVITFVLAIIIGFIVNIFVKKFPLSAHTDHHLEVHHHHGSFEKVLSNFKENMKNITFERAILIAGILIFIISLASGILEHDHSHGIEGYEYGADFDHRHEHMHTHAHGGGFMFSERWLNLLFVGIGAITLVIICLAKNHFLTEHLWGHIIKQHFLKIFLWTLGALILIYVLMQFIDVEKWMHDNLFVILILALLVGIIPQSGPHMIFITMFAAGHIPLSILLANTIVQDGHAGLPLLAETKRGFFSMKAIKIVVGLIVGILGYFIGF
ncbi:MAG: putative manganese transporter [Prevotellaceae bacterium]|jgi:hypothetical protein|nr:putative manganese transporter [Prevotellaceae bacterium]